MHIFHFTLLINKRGRFHSRHNKNTHTHRVREIIIYSILSLHGDIRMCHLNTCPLSLFLFSNFSFQFFSCCCDCMHEKKKSWAEFIIIEWFFLYCNELSSSWFHHSLQHCINIWIAKKKITITHLRDINRHTKKIIKWMFYKCLLDIWNCLFFFNPLS